MKDIRIFVASSKELERERNYLAFLVLSNEEEFAKRGFRLRLAKWEYIDPRMTVERTEDRYLAEMNDCDAALILFRNVVGIFTCEEMDKALEVEQTGMMRLKTHRILFSADASPESDAIRFREKLSPESYSVFSDLNDLRREFIELVNRVVSYDGLRDAPSSQHSRTITAFLAADEELAEERDAFADTVLNVNDLLELAHRNIRVQLRFYDPAHAVNIVESSEMGLVLYGTNYRVFGRTEIEDICVRMKDGRLNPKCFYVFFRNLDEASEKSLDEAFKTFRNDFVSEFGHFPCQFGDANAIRLGFVFSLERYVSESIGQKEIYSTVSVPTAPVFVGREDELRKLRGLLEPGPGTFPAGRLSVIIGAGGTGKSELVRQYASQFRVEYPGGLFQVDMEHVRTWDEAFLGILKGVPNNGVNVADFLDLKSKDKEPKESEPLTGADVRNALLRHARESGPILLVLDNVEKFAPFLGGDGGFQKAFPTGLSRRVVVNVVATARVCDVNLRETDWAVPFRLGDLSPDAALEVVLGKRNVDAAEREAAGRVAELLGYRALYLRRVPALIDDYYAQTICDSYADLAKALEVNLFQTIAEETEETYLPEILWKMTRECLLKMPFGTECVKLAQVASFFSPDGFPRHILKHLWDVVVAPGLDEKKFNRVVKIIEHHNIFQSTDPVRLHRLDRVAIMQTAQAEPGLEEAVGKALTSYEGMSPECWVRLADCIEILRYAPGEARFRFGETLISLRAILSCLNVEYDCGWDKLDSWDYAYLLSRKPQLEDKCPWEKLDGYAWVELLGRQPRFKDKCPWEKLDGWDWARLLGRRPQFADTRLFTYKKLNSRNWANLLGHQPQFSKACPWERLKRELSAWHWSHLLCRQPRFEDKCPWEKLDGWDWARLLRCQPQFEDKCPWVKLDGKAWARLLGRQPRFADRCPWAKLDGKAWARLLGRQPRFADRCPWKKLSAWNWACLLSRQPQFADMDECPWEKLDGYAWARLLSYQPQFAERCSWKKLGGNAWADLLCRQPQFSHRCSWGMLDGNAWVHLLVCQPQFADCYPWEMLSGSNWARLLAERPDFAGFCHWDKFSKDDWTLLLKEQPQFACHKHTRPKGETN